MRETGDAYIWVSGMRELRGVARPVGSEESELEHCRLRILLLWLSYPFLRELSEILALLQDGSPVGAIGEVGLSCLMVYRPPFVTVPDVLKWVVCCVCSYFVGENIGCRESPYAEDWLSPVAAEIALVGGGAGGIPRVLQGAASDPGLAT